MARSETERKLIIAGPCATESPGQIIGCARELKERKVDAVRLSLWKPRTRPGGFEGVGEAGIPWAREVIEMGLAVATEVMLPEHVVSLAKQFNRSGERTQLILWLGSRNQNHLVQERITRRIQESGLINTLLMIKNQPWEEKKHWLGILEHVLSTGFPEERILLCHRGFAPSGRENPHRFRNLPNFEMAMEVREETGRPMILDPSHIGGTVENVFRVVRASLALPFDGYMVEVHPKPEKAKTDARQQLTISQLDSLLEIIRRKGGPGL